MKFSFSSGLIVYLGIKGVLKLTSESFFFLIFFSAPIIMTQANQRPSFYTDAGTAGLSGGSLVGLL